MLGGVGMGWGWEFYTVFQTNTFLLDFFVGSVEP